MLVVVTPPQAEVVSIQTMRAHSRILGTCDDALLASYIKAARRSAETLIERLIGVHVLRLTLTSFPAAIDLPRPPIVSVASVRYRDETGTWQTLAGAAYEVDLAGDEPCIRTLSAWPATWPNGGPVVEVNYSAGYSAADCPEEVKAYICLRAASLFEHREADSDKPALPQPFAERLLDGVRRWHS